MKLNKRNCDTKIRLTPCGSDFTKVQMKIGDDINEFFLSGVMGDQFSSFLRALYCLYEEDDLEHYRFFGRRGYWLERHYPNERNDKKHQTRAELNWDGEGYGHAKIILCRESESLSPAPLDIPDPISLIVWRRKIKNYTVDGRDLCYAVAKAYTQALKKYGLKGYLKSGTGHYLGDSIDIQKLLFVKAYALGVLDEVQKTEKLWKIPHSWMNAFSTPFENEMELLLFDM